MPCAGSADSSAVAGAAGNATAAGGSSAGSANGYASGGGTTADARTAAGGTSSAGAGVSAAQGGRGPPAQGQAAGPPVGTSPGSGAPPIPNTLCALLRSDSTFCCDLCMHFPSCAVCCCATVDARHHAGTCRLN